MRNPILSYLQEKELEHLQQMMQKTSNVDERELRRLRRKSKAKFEAIGDVWKFGFAFLATVLSAPFNYVVASCS